MTKEDSTYKSSSKQFKFPWSGIILITIGAIFLMETMDILNIGNVISKWWPLAVIAVGFFKIKGDNKSGGAIIFIVGVALLTATLGIINWGAIFQFWPVILILIGISMISRPKDKHRWKFMRSTKSTDNFVKISTIFGGVEQRIHSESLEGGDVQAIFGGVELDMRNAVIAEGGAEFNLTALFGGLEVIVPPNTQVVMTGTPILGGLENKVHLPETEEPLNTIRCHCTVAFGGIEIKN